MSDLAFDWFSKMAVGQPRDREGKWTASGHSGGFESNDAETIKHFKEALDANFYYSKIGPNAVAVSQMKSDVDLRRIASQGERFEGRNRVFIEGADGECHWNVAKLYTQGKVDGIVVGYASIDHKNWHQHTWGLRKGKVVETTQSNVTAFDFKGIPAPTHYFGAELSKIEAAAYSKFMLNNPPGRGRHV